MNNRTLFIQLVVVAMVGFSIVASLLMRRFLPPRFLLDDALIQRIILDPSYQLDNTSFHAIAAVYRYSGLGYAPPLAAMVALILIAVAIFSAVRFEEFGRLGFIGLTVLGLSLLFGLVYLGQYTKEVLSLAIVVMVLRAGRSRGWDMVIFSAALLYGLTVRPYWTLTAFMYIGFLFLLRRTKNPFLILGAIAIVYVVLEPLFLALVGGGLESQRDLVNQYRMPGDVGSLIVSPLREAEGPLAVLSGLLMLLNLLVPVALLMSGSPYLMFSAILLSFLWTVVVIGIVKGRARDDGSRDGRRRMRAAALLLASVSIQALFEPDYGSYIKHLAPLLPLILTLVPLLPPVREVRHALPRTVEARSS